MVATEEVNMLLTNVLEPDTSCVLFGDRRQSPGGKPEAMQVTAYEHAARMGAANVAA